MKRSVQAVAIGMGICLGIFSAYADDAASAGRMVCDENCKLGSAEPAGFGKASKPAAKAPGFSVVSPVGRSAVKPISQVPRLKTLSGKTIAVAVIALTGSAEVPSRRANPEAKLHRFSTTIEKERPQLNEETKRLIAACRRDPSEANRAALKAQVERNYDAVVARKKAKLEELKRTARDRYKVEEMQNIVDEMLRDRDQRVENSMRRFTDSRFRPGLRNRSADGFQQVLGAGENVSISYAPVTNEEYAKFIAATGWTAPRDWRGGKMPEGKAKHPVVNVSAEDAAAYCKYLTGKAEGRATYRLPTEAEWEAAAGHMPKDADFNCGENEGTTPVDAYAKTLSACGAVDMWGNVWEWTATLVGGKAAVKGGAWDSRRTECRTEARGVGRDPKQGYANVGFRVIREDREARPARNGSREGRPDYRRNGRRL